MSTRRKAPVRQCQNGSLYSDPISLPNAILTTNFGAALDLFQDSNFFEVTLKIESAELWMYKIKGTQQEKVVGDQCLSVTVHNVKGKRKQLAEKFMDTLIESGQLSEDAFGSSNNLVKASKDSYSCSERHLSTYSVCVFSKKDYTDTLPTLADLEKFVFTGSAIKENTPFKLDPSIDDSSTYQYEVTSRGTKELKIRVSR